MQMEQEGILPVNIIRSGICTYTDPDDYFSARRLGVDSGRIYTGIIIR
ncbi:MAG: laccase domain-containing protein [Prevotella sp.]